MEISKTEMSNGAVLYHAFMPWSHIVMSGVLVEAGTNDESWPEEAGLAHASEHMRFQGTEKFPDSGAISAHIEDVGGVSNAWTNHEGTFFYQIVPAREFKRSLVVSSQLLLHAKFPEEKIKIEMDNIVQEIKRANDDHRSFLWHKFAEHLYCGYRLERMVLGNEKTVSSFTQDRFIKFARRAYKSSKFIFIVAGNVKKDLAVKLFEKYFTVDSATAVQDNYLPSNFGCNLTGKKVDLRASKIYSRDVEQIHMQIGYGPFERRKHLVAALNVFSAMIDGGMSFPLFQIVRDQNGLCYEIGADFEKHPDLCHFEIYVGTDPKRYEKAEELILKIIDESKKDRKLLRRAKELLLGRLAFAYDNPSTVASQIAHSITASGYPRSRQEIACEINSVNIEQVEETVSTYLNPGKRITVMLKPQWMTIQTT